MHGVEGGEIPLRDTMPGLEALDDVEVLSGTWGVAEISASGVVVRHNQIFAEIFQRTEQDIIQGQNFFAELCPWANHPLFLGRFLQGIQRGGFPMDFPFLIKRSTDFVLLRVKLHQAALTGRLWMFVHPTESSTAKVGGRS